METVLTVALTWFVVDAVYTVRAYEKERATRLMAQEWMKKQEQGYWLVQYMMQLDRVFSGWQRSVGLPEVKT